MTERISWYPIAPRESLAPETQTLFNMLEEKLGFVPNVFLAFSWKGPRFDKWRAHFEDLMQPSPGLGKAERGDGHKRRPQRQAGHEQGCGGRMPQQQQDARGLDKAGN